MGENTVDKLLWKAWINAGSKFLLYFKGNVFRSARHKKKILFCKQFRLMEPVRPGRTEDNGKEKLQQGMESGMHLQKFTSSFQL